MARKEIRQHSGIVIVNSDQFLMQKASNNKTVKVTGENILPPDIITADDIDWSDGVGWEELTRATAGAGTDTLTTAAFTARKYLKVIFFLLPTGGTITGQLRLGSGGVVDTGNNYSNRYSSNGGADSTNTSQSSMNTDTGVTNQTSFGVMNIINVATQEKLVFGEVVGRGTAGAANAPNRRESTAKWVNTSAQANIVSLFNSGAGDFAAGSQVVVLGRD